MRYFAYFETPSTRLPLMVETPLADSPPSAEVRTFATIVIGALPHPNVTLCVYQYQGSTRAPRTVAEEQVIQWIKAGMPAIYNWQYLD